MVVKELIEMLQKSSDILPIQIKSDSGLSWKIVKIKEKEDKPILEIRIR